jgi:hypothetical protein
MSKILDRYFGSIIFALALICYFQFFRFSAVPYMVKAISQVAMSALLIILIIVRVVYYKDSYNIKMHFKGLILTLVIASLPSYFIAYSYHHQSFLISLYANKLIFFYLLYFFLHLYKVPVKDILRIFVVTGLLAVLLYYAQLAVYPRFFMDVVSMETRGTIRLFIAGMICTIVAYFYFLNRFFETYNYRALIFALICFSTFLLQGTRQLIFGTIFLTLVNIIISNRVKSKALIILLISFASVAVFFVFREIFMGIAMVSSNQAQNFESDIRVQAANFFLTDFMPTDWAYIFGNGNSDAGSPYDIKITYYALKYKFFQSDIGVLGDYVKYGIVFTIAGLILIARALLFKIPGHYVFLKFYILAQCFTLLTGKGIFGGTDIVIVSILYIFDAVRAEYTETVKQETLYDSGNLSVVYKNA